MDATFSSTEIVCGMFLFRDHPVLVGVSGKVEDSYPGSLGDVVSSGSWACDTLLRLTTEVPQNTDLSGP